MKRRYALLLLILAPLFLMGIGPFALLGQNVQTVCNPAAGSGVTSFFTTDLAPTATGQGSRRFYTTPTTANCGADKLLGTLAYCNDLKNPSQGVLAYVQNGGNAKLEIITAYNAVTGATTRTTLVNTAVTFSSGAQLVLVVDMNQDGDGKPYATMFYNNAIVGTRQDLSAYSSWVKVNRKHAIFSTTAVTVGSVVFDYGPIVLQADLLNGWDFTSGWSASYSATITNANTITSTGANAGISKVVGVVGVLYNGSFSATPSQGSVAVRSGDESVVYIVNNSSAYFMYKINGMTNILNNSTAAGQTLQVNILTVRRVQ